MVPVIARQELAVGPVAYGLLGSAAGLGALFSAFAIGSLPPRLAGRVFSGAPCCLCAASSCSPSRAATSCRSRSCS